MTKTYVMTGLIEKVGSVILGLVVACILTMVHIADAIARPGFSVGFLRAIFLLMC